MTKQSAQSGTPMKARHHKVVLRAFLVAIGMFGFGYALVPLYSVFCDLTGLNGKVANEAQQFAGGVDTSRKITVQFVSSLGQNLPWEFYPLQKSVEVHPGELTKVAFFARNKTSKDMISQAVPSISPGLSASYFRKTECFCFTQQVLKAGEAIAMPVTFAIDPAIPDEYQKITLSYTMFELKKPTNQPHPQAGRLTR